VERGSEGLQLMRMYLRHPREPEDGLRSLLVFSRFEYALKRPGFLVPNKKDALGRLGLLRAVDPLNTSARTYLRLCGRLCVFARAPPLASRSFAQRP
jgi:hypothetical protein